MKVSIIVPIYNVEKYIENCLRSILEQTYKNLEIILVDDCGKDNSVNIALNLLNESDIPYKIIHHNKNRGLSAARNSGIKVSSGDYIYFLDSDDYITTDCIEVLLKGITNNLQPDFVIADYTLVGSVELYPQLLLKEDLIEDGAKILSSYAKGEWYMMAWNKLVNKNFLIQNNLYFKEGILHEDQLWSFQLACSAKSMQIIKKKTYFYIIRNNSITTSFSTKNYKDIISIIGECIKLSQNYNIHHNRDIHNYIENLKIGLILKISKHYKINELYNSYVYIRSLILNKDIKWFFKSNIKDFIRDLHIYLPPFLGIIYIISIYKIKEIYNFFVK